MAFLLEHLPKNVRLVIATRAESLLSVTFLRARGQLVEVVKGDLRFTFGEPGKCLSNQPNASRAAAAAGLEQVFDGLG